MAVPLYVALNSTSNDPDMRHHLGIALQLLALAFLPSLIVWQLTFGFRLIWMPALLLVGFVLFSIGTRLREA